MTRAIVRSSAAALSAVVLVAACSQHGDVSAAGELRKLRTIPFENLQLVTGGGPGDVLGVVYTDSSSAGAYDGFRATLHTYRRDPAFPDDLVDLGDTYLGVDTLYHRTVDAAITPDWATVTLNYNESAAGWVALVSLAGDTPSLAATIPLNPTLDAAVASGRWLLVAAGAELGLFDLADAAHPALVPVPFVASSPVTALVPVPDGFLAFTAGGYVAVRPDPVAPEFVQATDPVLRNFRRAIPDRGELVLAGPSLLAGKSRVVRAALSSGVPALLHSTEFEGNFVELAFDGGGAAVLQTQDASRTLVRVLREREGGFDERSSSAAPGFGGPGRLAARSGAVCAADPVGGGMSLYRLR